MDRENEDDLDMPPVRTDEGDYDPSRDELG
jgi:hypothetical protein